MRRIIAGLIIALIGSLFAPPTTADDQRFQAEFVDGSRIAGDELRNWHETAAQPVLSNKPLFDPANRARWVIDTALKVTAPPDAFVEFLGGDRLPGAVVGASSGTESKYHRLPAHLILDRQSWNFPGVHPPTPLRVQTRWIRRVVWQRRATDRIEPGTLFYADGRRISFRAVRWAASSVMLLLEQNTAEIAFHDIAELHLPNTDVWTAYLEQLSILCPGGLKPLFQWETQHGLRVTGSAERFQAKPHGNQNDPNAWWHLVQPAWSLDPIWVSHRTIRTRRFFEPNVVPLTTLEPIRSTRVAGLGSGWTWLRDRNVQSGPLQSGGNEYGWGLGVQAHHELEYTLPPGTQTFRTRIGLDRCIGNGGCARGKIFVGSNDQPPLFQTGLLIGSADVADSGNLNVAGQKNLILIADSAETDRPMGADPFDIRDSLDWLEPELLIDSAQLQDQIRSVISKLMPAWEGWTVIDADTGPFLFKNRWLTIDNRDPRYITEITSRVPFLTISKTIKVSPQQAFLVLAASRFAEGTTPAHLQVRVNGENAGDFEVPVRTGAADPDPILVPLQAYRGKEVQLEVSHMAGGSQALVNWSSVTFSDRRPGLLALFEDDAKFLDQLRDGGGQAELDRAEAYSGSAALKVVKGEAGNAFLFHEPLVIRENPKLGEYRFLRFVWRKKEGTPLCLQLVSSGRYGEEKTQVERQTLRYDAGQGERSHGGARRMDEKLPTEWVVVTRDLVGDWGEFSLSGLSFGTPDDQPAWLDHVYVGRSWQELDQIQAEAHPSRKKKK